MALQQLHCGCTRPALLDYAHVESTIPWSVLIGLMGALAIYATLRDAVEIASDFEIVNEQA
jgi:hypothetical protein